MDFQYGEKLVLLSQASESIISALPSIPPTAAEPYSGAQTTAATRAALQKTLDNYKVGSISHAFQPTSADLNRSDSRSFGITHAKELSSIGSVTGSSVSNLPVTPPAHDSVPASTQAYAPPPITTPLPNLHAPVPLVTAKSTDSSRSGVSATSPGVGSPPVNLAALNNAPAPVPRKSGSGDVTSSMLPLNTDDSATTLPIDEGPTVAETGVPLTAGAGGPGPASGSIHDLKSGTSRRSSSGQAPGYGQSSPQYGSFGQTSEAPAYGVVPGGTPESAEDEKKRLEREERERVLRDGAPPSSFKSPTSGTGAKYETAEEEKARLERAERDKLLTQGGSSGANKDGDQGTPPPYQDF